MIVHFIGSKANIPEEGEIYKQIITAVKDLGHTLAWDWVGELHEITLAGQKVGPDDWARIDKKNVSAISRADVVVVEATSKGFFAGYQVAQAVNLKKPILILTRDDSPLSVAGLSTPKGFVKSIVYGPSDIKNILAAFLAENDIQTKDMRFNFFIDRPIYNYLRWMSVKTGKTKAEILRELVEREIDRNNS